MQTFRTERLSKEIKKILSERIAFLGNEIGGGLVSITSVRISKDLSLARIYISAFATKITPLEVIAYLDENKAIYRTDLAKKMRVRIVPNLKFFLDDTLDEIENIQKLIDSVKE
jgi:ribosome-binding factor A